MVSTASSKKPLLALWLLACPLLLAAAVLVLPRFNQLYGTTAEKCVLLLLLASPLLGAAGILRHVRFTLPVRLLLAAGYVIAGLAVALPAIIFVGCSWAGACF